MFSSSNLVAEGIVTVNVTFVIGVATEVVRTATVIEWRVPVAAVVWIAIRKCLLMPSDYEDNTAAKVLNVIVELKVEIIIRFITLKMILLFSVYIGCFTGTAKIIREIIDVLVLCNIILNNDG